MQKFLFIFLLISLSASLLRRDSLDLEGERFVVWNIGQGQWTTLITEQHCDHFDVGGEFDLSKKILRLCSHREHRVHISHWDWDHMGLIKKLRKRHVSLCLWNYPLGEASVRKKILLEGLPACKKSVPMIYQSIFSGDTSLRASSNDTSQVVQTHGILIPGDSTKKEEKRWSFHPALMQTLGLILGHHGSRSSTSDLLLDHLPKLRWAVATARKKRYGHPHAEVLLRLREHHVPVLKTEDWGSLIFEL